MQSPCDIFAGVSLAAALPDIQDRNDCINFEIGGLIWFRFVTFKAIPVQIKILFPSETK